MIQLTRRERRFGIGMMAVGAVWALYGLAIEPMRDRIHTLQRVIPEKQNELREVQASSAKYLALRQEVENVQARMAEQDPNFQLQPFLLSLIEQHQLSSHMAVMERNTRPSQPGYSETVVEIGLEGITLRQLVEFLRAVETSGVMARIGGLEVRKDASNTTGLNATVQIHSTRLSHNAVAADLSQS